MPRKELAESMSGEEKNTNYFSDGTGWNLCCKQATYLLLKKEELKKLSFKDESALKFHLSFCKFCRAFKKQSVLLNKLISETGLANNLKLGERDKSNLKSLINSNLNLN